MQVESLSNTSILNNERESLNTQSPQNSSTYHSPSPSHGPANPPISPTSNPETPTLGISGILLSEVASKPVTWLWPQRIPQGKLTLLDAAPNSGLSLLALTIAASISSGTPLPSDTSANVADPSTLSDPPVGADLSCPPPIDRPPVPGTVILISPHDSPADTLKPRLHAAGANLDHILLLNTITPPTAANEAPQARPFCLPHDLALLESTIIRNQAVLVIIDPLSTVLNLGRTSSQRQNLSHLLFSLAQLAERTSCAILLTRSLTRPCTPASLSHRSGSLDLAAIRSALLLAPDPIDHRKRLLLTTHSPLCAPPVTLTYEIIATEQHIPTIHWRGERHDHPSLLLGSSPTFSTLRKAIFSFLSRSSTPQGARDIVQSIGYDYECVRKMLFRMAQAGDLLSTARGLYTTPGHPSFTSENADQHPIQADSFGNMPNKAGPAGPITSETQSMPLGTRVEVSSEGTFIVSDGKDGYKRARLICLSELANASKPQNNHSTSSPPPVPNVPNANSPTNAVPSPTLPHPPRVQNTTSTHSSPLSQMSQTSQSHPPLKKHHIM